MLTQQALKSIYQLMIQPTLSYCGFLSLNQTEGQRNKLRSFHNRACLLIDSNCNKQVNIPSSIDITSIRSCQFIRQC